ncbi:MAG: VOC family protein [Clostridiales bacterium]|nr:VOC family protein [Clostridiales bacterium]
MKITTFNPQIITKDAESTAAVFEALGFERTHTKENIGEHNVTGIRLKEPGGFNLDISQFESLPVESLTGIRMNVDDFDEAYRILTEQGFKNFYGDSTADTPSSKSAILISPAGVVINLVEHIK